ncbi:MAG: hypothetical protein P4L46_00435 [Fimbriimonas sp.]|nr:hypothetical protein [Fimbriimonas sp.]
MKAVLRFGFTLMFLCACVGALAQSLLPVQWMYSTFAPGNSLAYSPDGKLLAIGDDGGVHILSLASGELASFPTAATGGIKCVRFTHDGKRLLAGGVNGDPGVTASYGILEVWDISSRNLVASLDTALSNGIWSMTVSPDDKSVAGCGYLGTFEIWNLTNFTLIKAVGLANAGILSLAWSPDGATIAVAGYRQQGGLLELWNVATCALTPFQSVSPAEIFSIAFSPDGKMLADGGVGVGSTQMVGIAELQSVATGTRSALLDTGGNEVLSVAFSVDGKTLAVGGELIFEVWDATAGKLLSSPATANNYSVNAVSFAPDGKTLADAGFSNSANTVACAVEQWNYKAGTLLTSLVGKSRASANSVAFSPDDRQLAVGGGIVRLFDAEKGGAPSSIATPAQDIASVVYSADGKTLADGGYWFPNQYLVGLVEIWDLATGNLLLRPGSNANFGVESVSLSPDGKHIVDGGFSWGGSWGSVVEFSDAESGQPIWWPRPTGAGINSVAFSPDSKTVISGGVGTLQVWDVPDKLLIASLSSSASQVACVAFSPDGKAFAVCGASSSGGVVELWDVASHKVLNTFALAPCASVRSVAFSTDGKVLFAGTG